MDTRLDQLKLDAKAFYNLMFNECQPREAIERYGKSVDWDAMNRLHERGSFLSLGARPNQWSSQKTGWPVPPFYHPVRLSLVAHQKRALLPRHFI